MDLLQREGKYPLPPQASKTIMGVEFAGVVSKIGEGAERWKVGDEVFGLAFGVSILLLGPRRHCDRVVAHRGDLELDHRHGMRGGACIRADDREHMPSTS